MAELTPFLIFAAVMVIVSVVMRYEIKRQEALFEQQALKRGGRVQKGHFLSYPRLRLPVHDAEMEVYMTPGSRNRPPYTYIKMDLAHLRDYNIRLYREIRFLGIGTVFGQDILIGNPDFDDAYVIQGSDPLIVQNFLQHGIQQGLLNIKDWQPTLEIHNGRFSLHATRALRQTEDMDVFIELGREMIGRLREIG